MKKTIQELNENFKKYRELSIKHKDAMNALATLEIENKASVIDELRKKAKAAEDKATEYREAVYALQKVCTHNNPDGTSAFRSSGYDSHYSYETCDICGYEIKI